jgi:aspartate 1-decarboxylase
MSETEALTHQPKIAIMGEDNQIKELIGEEIHATVK